MTDLLGLYIYIAIVLGEGYSVDLIAQTYSLSGYSQLLFCIMSNLERTYADYCCIF